jgi:hypothetical protein
VAVKVAKARHTHDSNAHYTYDDFLQVGKYCALYDHSYEAATSIVMATVLQADHLALLLTVWQAGLLPYLLLLDAHLLLAAHHLRLSGTPTSTC